VVKQSLFSLVSGTSITHGPLKRPQQVDWHKWLHLGSMAVWGVAETSCHVLWDREVIVTALRHFVSLDIDCEKLCRCFKRENF
jgi:hypothetical protein